jgi:arsenite methyltransferase
MSMTTRSREYFARVAGHWDGLRDGFFGEAVRVAAIAKAYLRPDMVVADVGAGTGFMAAALAPLVHQIYAIDGSAAMLEVAQRNLASYENVVFKQADGQALPLDDGSVDVVFANMYLHHCPDPAAAIRQMVRVLRPGGRLVITDLDVHDQEWMREEMADEWLGFQRDQVRAWLREADLVNVIVDTTDQTCCAASQSAHSAREDNVPARIGVFVATGSRRVTGARDAVQAGYGAVAVSGSCGCSSEANTGQDCCSPGSGMDRIEAPGSPAEVVLFAPGYSAAELAALPPEAAGLSLGCGNPVAISGLRPGEVVLDIGSGGGLDAFHAARKVGQNGRVIGLDMTPAMIERARRTAAAAGLSQVEFRLGQAEAMPVEDGEVDAVISNCVINLCEDKGKVFEEAYRVLRERGRLVISDMVTDGPLSPSLRSDPASWAGCVHGALPEQEYLDLLTQAGFHDVAVARGNIGGEIGGVRVYSLSVSASKGPSESPRKVGDQPRSCCCGAG